MKYRYKMAYSVKIDDVLHVNDYEMIEDKEHDDVAPHRVKTPYALRVSSIEQDSKDANKLLFIDRSTERIIRAAKDKRIRLANMKDDQGGSHDQR